MANEEHLAILLQGVEVWNRWRKVNQGSEIGSKPDLSMAKLENADLSGINLEWSNLEGANLQGAFLYRACLIGAQLVGANLVEATLAEADLTIAHLEGANLRGAHLNEATFDGAYLQGASLECANLSGTHFQGARFGRANLTDAKMGFTELGATDLSGVMGLETVGHSGPSTIGIDSLYMSAGNLPEAFMRACGVADSLIRYLPSLIGSTKPSQFYSCFISYSTKDTDFAQQLHGWMQNHSLRVWFAPEELKGGQKLQEQIDHAIRIHDKLVLVLSEHSIQSDWVMTEIRKARKSELLDKRRKLFPIRLVDFDTLRDWQCFDADTGKDLAVEVREYYIPDFTHWKDHDAFEREFHKLLAALKAE